MLRMQSSKTSKTAEVCHIQGKNMSHSMDIHGCGQACIVHLHS